MRIKSLLVILCQERDEVPRRGLAENLMDEDRNIW